MSIRVSCPACGSVSYFDERDAGREADCPSCQRPIEIPGAEEPILDVVPEEPVLEVEPEPPILDVVGEEPRPSSGTRRRVPSIDEEEAFDGHVDSEVAATALLRQWRADMPEVASAYQPSGVLPAMALVNMSIGATVGAPAGTVAGGLVAAVGGGLLAALGWLIALILFCGFIVFAMVALFGLLGLVVVLLTFSASGWVSAVFTTEFGRWAKNRNVRAAVLFSTVSAGLSVVLAWVLFQAFAKPILVDHGWIGPQIGDFDILSPIAALLGGAFAVFIARRTAADRIRAAKFCEECERHMERSPLKKLGLSGLRAMAHALNQNRLAEAVSALDLPPGESGEADLFTCPSCSRGYVELKANFKAVWKETKDKKEKTESWLVSSVELGAEDMKRFRADS
jgi:hypothetical protein